jgi:hypothetical protein
MFPDAVPRNPELRRSSLNGTPLATAPGGGE